MLWKTKTFFLFMFVLGEDDPIITNAFGLFIESVQISCFLTKQNKKKWHHNEHDLRQMH